ncbi:hypothetical protein [Tautonia plasticadhaerens]|uniref:Uncharacterized protein n=1 Tax=Tautonia plasticadhaerens TaxID=2527974 RepID=A0A518HFG2_9BACT|nr:hypothetical protein [Tautonia plasticadhaerens]QDV39587.1 hypothetical protein ElP_75580 [Tautonia plasticadhaerens]
MNEVQSHAISQALRAIGADATPVLVANDAWVVEVLSRDRRTLATVSEDGIEVRNNPPEGPPDPEVVPPACSVAFRG